MMKYNKAQVIEMLLDNYAVGEEFTNAQVCELAGMSSQWFNNATDALIRVYHEDGRFYCIQGRFDKVRMRDVLTVEKRHKTIEPATVKWYNELMDIELYAPKKPAGKGWKVLEEKKERGYDYYVYSFTAEQAKQMEDIAEKLLNRAIQQKKAEIQAASNAFDYWTRLYHKYMAKANRYKEFANKAAQHHNNAVSVLTMLDNLVKKMWL